jgi:hypothetical protein
MRDLKNSSALMRNSLVANANRYALIMGERNLTALTS